MVIPLFNLFYPCSYLLAPSHRDLSLSIPVVRRQGSTDSDEHARPKKKKATTVKKKKQAPSTSPSASDPDDADYVGEEEEVSAPRHSVGQSKPGTRRAPVPQVRGSAMPVVHGRRISMELPDSGGRPTHDFTTVGAGQYLQFRRDVNQYEMVADAEDPRFRTRMQQDLYSSFVRGRGLAPHSYLDLNFLRENPDMFPNNPVKIIDDMTLGPAMTFRCDWNEAAILQFYATCFFGPDNTLTWMTDNTTLSITYDRFVQILGLSGVGHRIHSMDPEHKPKAIDACLPLVKPTSQLTKEELAYPLNEVSIFRAPYYILYQCVLRTLYPKKGDRSRAYNYCIDLMVRMHDKPTEPLDTAHFIWHEIRLCSFIQTRQFPHAPFIQALIDHTAPFEVVKTAVHSSWKPASHMRVMPAAQTAARSQSKRPAGGTQPTDSSVPSSSSAPRGRLAMFLSKAQSAIMRSITFSCQQNHDVQKRLIISKNQLKQRLRDRGSPVSDDDPIPAAPSTSTFGFPSRDEYPEFFDDHDDIRQE